MVNANRNPRVAFTLIELVVVVVILGVLASLAVYSLGGTMDRYQLSQAAELIERFDARARRDARTRRVPILARIDRGRGRLSITQSGLGHRTSFRMPSQVKIKQIRVRRRITAGTQFDIAVNGHGQSSTYAILLERGKASRWLVVIGFSGQVLRLDTKGEVDAILSL